MIATYWDINIHLDVTSFSDNILHDIASPFPEVGTEEENDQYLTENIYPSHFRVSWIDAHGNQASMKFGYFADSYNAIEAFTDDLIDSEVFDD